MELFLVLLIAILLLKPADVKALARFLGKLFAFKKNWQQKAHLTIHKLTESTKTPQHNGHE